MQSSISGAHTRTNSSKAQSLRGSIVMQKPIGSHFSSITSQGGLPNSFTKNLEKIDKQVLNKFLRETFAGILPKDHGIHSLLRGKCNISDS